MSVPANALAQLIVILGPTASGKSALAISLAEKLGGEVLVCDSTGLPSLRYRHAKVPLAEQRGVPHHLVDLVEPTDVFTAGEYRRRAIEVLEAFARVQSALLNAGTGLYLRALFAGLAEAPERSEALRERLREKAERRGPEHLHRCSRGWIAKPRRDRAARYTKDYSRDRDAVLAGSGCEIHRSGRALWRATA